MKKLIYKFKQWLISKLKFEDIVNYTINKIILNNNSINEKDTSNLGINYFNQYKYLIGDFDINFIPFEVKINIFLLYYIKYASCNIDIIINKLRKNKFIFAIDLTDEDLFIYKENSVMKYFKLDDNIQCNTINKKYYDFKAMNIEPIFNYYLYKKSNKFDIISNYYEDIIAVINNKKEIKLYYTNPEIIGNSLIPINSRNIGVPCVNVHCSNRSCLVTHEKYFTNEWKNTYTLKEIDSIDYYYLKEELNKNKNKVYYAVNKLNKEIKKI